jgi:hypothetical protein
VFVRVAVYGSAAPTITAKLLNRTGQSMADLPVARAANGDQRARDVDLALSSLAPGEYLIELSDGTTGTNGKQLVGFRVTS